jgi:hypothetical protein
VGAISGLSQVLTLLLFRNEELSRVLLRVVDIGLRGGWAEFENHPIQLPHLQLDHFKPGRTGNLSSGNDRLEKATASIDAEKVSSSVAKHVDSVANSTRR